MIRHKRYDTIANMSRETLSVYKEFGIPPNLQEHMARVYGIVCFLENHWKGDQIDWNLVKKVALLHDMGNVVRFDFDNHPEFLGDEQKNIEHWKQIQKEVIAKYGTDDHEATKQMLQQIGIDQDSINIILEKSFGNVITTSTSDNWPLKILLYADLRTLPQGAGTLEERIQDIRGRMPKYVARPDFEDLVAAARNIETQIQQNTSVSVSEILNEVIAPHVTDALKFQI